MKRSGFSPSLCKLVIGKLKLKAVVGCSYLSTNVIARYVQASA